MPSVLSILPVAKRIEVLRFAESYGFAQDELEKPLLLEAFAQRLGVCRNTVNNWVLRGLNGIRFEPLVMGRWRRYTLLRWVLWQLAVNEAKAKRRQPTVRESLKAREKSYRMAEEKLRREHPNMFRHEKEQPCPTAK